MEETVNTAVKEIREFDDKLVKESKGWKSKLTGGLGDEQITISLLILGLFYTIYSITNYTLGNTRDQYTIVSACYCNRDAKVPYRVSFGLLLSLWIIAHTYIFITRNSKYLKIALNFFAYCCCCCYDRESKEWRKCLQDGGKCIVKTKRSIWDGVINCLGLSEYFNPYSSISQSSNDKHHKPGDREISKLQRYEKILWYRYYQLYVVGYSKDINPDKPNKASSDLQSKGYNCFDAIDGCKGCCIDCYRYFWNLIYFILVLLKYIAQGTTVPLLMLQMFDTYALLCFSPDGTYCESVSEYKVHLAQAAITISFYLCIALAQLTNAMLDWYDQSSGQKNDKLISDWYDQSNGQKKYNPSTARDDQSSGQKKYNPSTARDDQSSGHNPSTIRVDQSSGQKNNNSSTVIYIVN